MKKKVFKIIGRIDEYTLEKFIDFVDKNKSKNLEILIHSNGGSGEATSGICDYMKSSGKHFIITGIGRVESAAVAILQAGNKKRAYPHTTFMTHQPTLGNNTFFNRLRNRKKLNIYIQNYQSFFSFQIKKKARYFDAIEAKELGLIDEIIK